MTDLSERALLVALNISQWTARKRDAKETARLERETRACAGAASVNKKLLPMSHDLDQVHKLTGFIRNEYYKLTLPWMEGMGIIKANSYMEFTQHFGELKTKWEDAVSKFLVSYEEAIDDARYLLGDLFSEDDYPHVDTVRRKFSMDISFYPVPSPKDCTRTSMLGDLAEGWAKSLAKQLSDRERESMAKAWQRVYDVVSKAHERLANPKNIFRDSLIENAQELCSILPSLNITDDPKLEQLRQDLESSLCAYDPQSLREDEVLRSEVADKMSDIMSKMGAFYAPVA